MLGRNKCTYVYVNYWIPRFRVFVHFSQEDALFGCKTIYSSVNKRSALSARGFIQNTGKSIVLKCGDIWDLTQRREQTVKLAISKNWHIMTIGSLFVAEQYLKLLCKTGKLVWWLRMLITHPKDPRSVPSMTWWLITIIKNNYMVSNILSLALYILFCKYMVHKYTCRQNFHVHKIKTKFKNLKYSYSIVLNIIYSQFLDCCCYL